MLARNQSLYFRVQQSVIGDVVNSIRYHLRLMQLIDQARTAYVQRRAQSRQPDVHREILGWEPTVYVEPTDPAWIEAWHITDGLLLLMRDEIRARGAGFLVVTGTSGMQVNPDPNARLESMRQLGVKDLFYPDFRIKALGDRDGFAVLNLGPPMQQYAEQDKTFLHGQRDFLGYGHWNSDGHRVAGQLIAQKICSEMLAGQ